MGILALFALAPVYVLCFFIALPVSAPRALNRLGDNDKRGAIYEFFKTPGSIVMFFLNRLVKV